MSGGDGMEREIEHLKERVSAIEERQNDLDKLVTTVAVLAEREKTVEGDVKEIKQDVKSLTGKSGKKWDNLTNQIIGIIVAAIAGFILAKIGL
jgi:predicted  nucleic acid-binding Zn-ribbon protein